MSGESFTLFHLSIILIIHYSSTQIFQLSLFCNIHNLLKCFKITAQFVTKTSKVALLLSK
jgi:hypothetical protein